MRRLLQRIARTFRKNRRVPTRVAAPPLEHPYREWLTQWASLWSVPDLPSKTHIVFSRRLTAALGRCTPQSGSIRLNPGLLEAPTETLREVVCHEAAHVAAWLLHGRRARPHGPEWKDLMRLAGYEPHVRWAEGSVPLGVRRRRPSTLTYVHACPVCGASWSAKRRVSRWRCAACLDAGLDGKLEITTRPARPESTR